MRIEIAPTRLLFYSRPWELWLSAAIFPIFGLPLLLLTFQVHSLVCNRTEQVQSTCEISHLTAFRVSSNKILLSKLKEAKIQELNTYESTPYQETKAYKVVLVADEKILDFEYYFNTNDYQGKQEITSRINAFLQNQKQLDLSVNQYPDFSSTLFYLVWNIFSWVFFVYACQITTCTLDKTLGTVNMKRQSLLGTKVIEYSLNQITNVVVHEASSDIPVEPVFLQLASGKSISVYRDSSFINWKKDADKIGNLIREFLCLPAA